MTDKQRPDLNAIRARDAVPVHPEVHDAVITPEEIGEPYVGLVHAYRDRRALLAYVDEQTAEILRLHEHCAALESREVCTVAHENVETCGYCQRDALLAAAGKVTCRRCLGHGDLLQPDSVPPGWRTDPCPDCSDLRRLMKEAGR